MKYFNVNRIDTNGCGCYILCIYIYIYVYLFSHIQKCLYLYMNILCIRISLDYDIYKDNGLVLI